MFNRKIVLDLSNLLKIKRQLKRKNKKIVHCHGVFDLLHLGHIKYLQSAKKLGDFLVVSLTDDKFIDKSPNRPIFTNKQRAEAISSLSCVDCVIINNNKTAINIIKSLKPDFYCKGADYKNFKNDLTNQISIEKKTVLKNKGKFRIINQEIFSSSKILNSHFNNFSKNIQKNIYQLKKEFRNIGEINFELEKIRNKKVLIIGETIIDEYTYCEAIGKSGKEPVLNFRELSSEKYIGGALAIANHLSSFCKEIHIISFLGQDLKHLSFIKEKLKKNVKVSFLRKKNSPTIVKKRLIEKVDKIKLLGIYDIDEKNISDQEANLFIKKINKNINNYDTTIVADFNHGILTQKVCKFIQKKRKDKFNLMSQINSSSLSNFSMQKFKDAGLVVINERELQHQMFDKSSDINILIKKFSKIFRCKKIIVTSGERGLSYYERKKNKILKYDAFTDKYIDKIGAGDVVFGVSSLLISSKVNENLSLLIASLAGYKAVNTIANKDFVDFKTIKNYLLNLFK